MGGEAREHLDPATIAVRAGGKHNLNEGVTPPIYMTSTFVHAGVPGPGDFSYGRGGSPANEPLERTLTDLEGGVDCVVFNAGVAAANAMLDEAVPGTAVVIPEDAYYGIRVRAQ